MRRAVALLVLLAGCEVTANGVPAASPSPAPAAASQEPDTDPAYAEAEKKAADAAKAKAKADEAETEAAGKAFSDKEEAAKAKAKKEQQEAKEAHLKACADFPARLAALQAALKKRPAPCGWIAAHCEQKKVAVTQGNKTFVTTDLVCGGKAPVANPKAWLAEHEAQCTRPVTAKDEECFDVDPLRLDQASDDEIAAFKSP